MGQKDGFFAPTQCSDFIAAIKGSVGVFGAVSANKPILNFLIDGNPHKLPRMVPARDWAPPSFPYPPFHDGNGHQPRSEPGPASLNSGYGSTHRSINYGVPFGKGMGVFSRSGQQSTRGNSRNRNRVDRGSAGRRFRAGKTGTSHNMGQSPASLRSPSAAARSRCRSG